jgi:hypothetical protein
MSVLSKSLKLSALQLVMALPALAATGERDLEGNLAVWIFLGFCALIIVAQLFPMAWHIIHKSSEHAAEQKQALEKVPKS